MIHDCARRATGGVLYQNELVGHCVLIGPRMAVTCAHCLSDKAARPAGPFQVCFRNLDDQPRLATIVKWAAHDPTLAPGSDIAVLTFDGPEFEQSEPWVRIDTNRPVSNAEIVALDFQTGRLDGDPRGGIVHDGRGHVISLAGEGFVSKGMSGGGLFHSDTGAQLLGIVSGKPVADGQTEGYAIPADEIAQLLPERISEPRIDAVTTLRDLSLPAFGDNFAPVIRRVFDRALRVLSRPSEDWSDDDILDLSTLQIELADEAKSTGLGVDVPQALAEKLAAFRGLLDSIERTAPAHGDLVYFEDDARMSEHLRNARAIVADLAGSSFSADEAQDRLEAVQDVLQCAEFKNRIRLGQLSAQSQAAVKAVGEPFRMGHREIMTAIGRKPFAAPPGTIFTDGFAAWAPEMVVIPACPEGFLMGTPEGQQGRRGDELQHKVRMPHKFALARYALTFEEYDAYCAETGVDKPGDQDWGRDRRPAINVSWEDTKAWCTWMAERTGATYRLPSEAEWEYACRGDASGANDTPFCPEIAVVGNGAFISATEANFDGTETFNGSAEGEYREKTVPVDHPEFRPNGFRIRQMHGNVYEWCEDVYESNYATTPTDGSAHIPQPLSEDLDRMVRGGSWLYVPQALRSAFRLGFGPDDRFFNVGFRPARTLFTS